MWWSKVTNCSIEDGVHKTNKTNKLCGLSPRTNCTDRWVTQRNWKVRTNFRYEFSIQTQHKHVHIDILRKIIRESCLNEYIFANKCSKCPPWNWMHASTHHLVHNICSKTPGQLRLVWHASTVRWSVTWFSVTDAYIRVLGVPAGPRVTWGSCNGTSSTYPSVMIGVTENISYSTAKTSRSTTMNVPYSCSNCQQYIFQRPPLCSSGQSSWLHNEDVLWFLWGTNWIYICYVEESRPPLCSSGQSSWLQNGDV
jgi:hypothetical protein